MPIFPKKVKEEKQRIAFIRRQQEEEKAKGLATSQNLPYINLVSTPIEMDALMLVPLEKAKKGLFIPFQKIGKIVGIAAVNSQDKTLFEVIEKLKNERFQVNLFVCSKTSLLKGWEDYKRIPPPKKAIVGKVEVSEEHLKQIQNEVKKIDDLKNKLLKEEHKESTWVIEVILGSALGFDASDIHIEPEAETVKLRYRLDGILYDIFSFKRGTYESILARLKLFAGLKLNIHEIAQDGRFSIFAEGQEIEVRVSVVPGEYGEDIVMRLLSPRMLLSVEELGLHPWLQKILYYQIRKPTGMILTCGPTGSGKTTTLYACLRYITKPEIKIITIEQPIEYHLKGVSQTQAEPEKGYDFATALRSILRQDPDIILVGEIRDRETAETALDASLTGHLVFSTLHTNDAAGIVPRLIEMGATPTTVAPALNLSIAQRLLRRVCKKCAKEVTPSKKLLSKIEKNLQGLPEDIKPDLSGIKIYKSTGCPQCHYTGYRGRIGIYEMFQLSPKIEEAIVSYPSVSQMRKVAIKEGMITMQQDGLLRVIEGITTIEELQRVTGLLE